MKLSSAFPVARIRAAVIDNQDTRSIFYRTGNSFSSKQKSQMKLRKMPAKVRETSDGLWSPIYGVSTDNMHLQGVMGQVSLWDHRPTVHLKCSAIVYVVQYINAFSPASRERPAS